MATSDEAVVDLVRRLVYEIEESPRTLHKDRGYSDRCLRLREGLAFTRAEDCDCGLDALLAEAHAFTAEGETATTFRGQAGGRA
jgi:hypothetical protein